MVEQEPVRGDYPALGTCDHPIHELICADIEEPMPSGHVPVERRRSARYARHLPATLIAGPIGKPAICRDIGFGGIRIDTPSRVELEPGDRATVRIKLRGHTFEDIFTVRDRNPTPEGTTLHMALQPC